MPGRPPLVHVTPIQQELLETICTAISDSPSRQQRAKIILLAWQRKRNDEIAEAVGMHRNHVRNWRLRWVQAYDRLVHVECNQGTDALRAEIIHVLSDLPRSGRPVNQRC